MTTCFFLRYLSAREVKLPHDSWAVTDSSDIAIENIVTDFVAELGKTMRNPRL